jgi:hypothetical protein
MRIRGSEIERKLWREKLADQWKEGGARIKEIQEYDSEVSAMKVSGSELFIEVFGKSEIHVYDISTYQLKFSLPSVKGINSAWDVHDDFMIIFDGKRFYLFDRRKNVTEDIDDNVCMQIGTHYKNHEDEKYVDDGYGVEYNNEHPLLKDPLKDAPAKIKIFKDSKRMYDERESAIIVIYKSGIASRWNYFTPYEKYKDYLDKDVTYDKFKLERVGSCDNLTVCANHRCLIRPLDVLVQHVYCCPDEPWEKYSQVFFKDRGVVDVCDLESDPDPSHQIDGVDKLYDYFESSTLGDGVSPGIDDGYSYEGFLVLKRTFNFVYEELAERKQFVKAFWYDGNGQNIPEGHPQTYDEWEKTLPIQEDDDEFTASILEVHVKVWDELSLRRRMRIEGNLMNATINDQHMAIAFQDTLSYNRINIYNAKEIIAELDYCEEDDVKYVEKPEPIQSINLGRLSLPFGILLAGPNRLIWNEMLDGPYEERYPVKYANFWMA